MSNLSIFSKFLLGRAGRYTPPVCKAVIISFLVSQKNFKIFRIGGGKKIKIGNPLNQLILIWQRIFRAEGKKICVISNHLSNVIGISMSSSMEAEFILAVAPTVIFKFAFPSETHSY